MTLVFSVAMFTTAVTSGNWFSAFSSRAEMEPARRLTSYTQQLRARLAVLHDTCRDGEMLSALDCIEQDAARLRLLVRDVQLYLAAGTPRGEVAMEDSNVLLSVLQQRLAAPLASRRMTLDIGALPPAILDRQRRGFCRSSC